MKVPYEDSLNIEPEACYHFVATRIQTKQNFQADLVVSELKTYVITSIYVSIHGRNYIAINPTVFQMCFLRQNSCNMFLNMLYNNCKNITGEGIH